MAESMNDQQLKNLKIGDKVIYYEDRSECIAEITKINHYKENGNNYIGFTIKAIEHIQFEYFGMPYGFTTGKEFEIAMIEDCPAPSHYGWKMTDIKHKDYYNN